MIQTESTPNPNSIKFLSEKTISDIGTEEFQKQNSEGLSNSFIKELLNFEGVELVLLSKNFISVKKKEEASWNDLKPMVISHLNHYFENNDEPILKDLNKKENNLNNEDDWRFFEEAFNNADREFLKKIKSMHESLTKNDLKLCAYLRLNLSSKDIAPLLNISLRSVEIKRYRLRKKIQLSHNEGLTEYILSI